jgi:hypothetical protein
VSFTQTTAQLPRRSLSFHFPPDRRIKPGRHQIPTDSFETDDTEFSDQESCTREKKIKTGNEDVNIPTDSACSGIIQFIRNKNNSSILTGKLSILDSGRESLKILQQFSQHNVGYGTGTRKRVIHISSHRHLLTHKFHGFCKEIKTIDHSCRNHRVVNTQSWITRMNFLFSIKAPSFQAKIYGLAI